jgi:hypothetical protein
MLVPQRHIPVCSSRVHSSLAQTVHDVNMKSIYDGRKGARGASAGEAGRIWRATFCANSARVNQLNRGALFLQGRSCGGSFQVRAPHVHVLWPNEP